MLVLNHSNSLIREASLLAKDFPISFKTYLPSFRDHNASGE